MSHVQVYDRALCCSTGVCGPQVDPVLPKFAADLEWLAAQGHSVERYNLAHDPAQFSANAAVQQLLEEEGVQCLPLIFIDGRVASRRDYPSRGDLALWTGTRQQDEPAMPIVDGDCCGGSSCC